MSIYDDYVWYKKQDPKHALSFNNFYVRITKGDTMESILAYRPRAHNANKLWLEYKKISLNPVSKIYFLSCYRKGMRGEELFSIESKGKRRIPNKSETQKRIDRKRIEQGMYKDSMGKWQQKK